MAEYYFIRLSFEGPYDRLYIRDFIGEYNSIFESNLRDRKSYLLAKFQGFLHMIENNQVKFVKANLSSTPKIEYKTRLNEESTKTKRDAANKGPKSNQVVTNNSETLTEYNQFTSARKAINALNRSLVKALNAINPIKRL
jgi:hypothetical protein